jgi:hypothetical protein
MKRPSPAASSPSSLMALAGWWGAKGSEIPVAPRSGGVIVGIGQAGGEGSDERCLAGRPVPGDLRAGHAALCVRPRTRDVIQRKASSPSPTTDDAR